MPSSISSCWRCKWRTPTAPGASSRSMKSLGSSLSDTATAIGNYLASGRSIFSRYFAWAGC